MPHWLVNPTPSGEEKMNKVHISFLKMKTSITNTKMNSTFILYGGVGLTFWIRVPSDFTGTMAGSRQSTLLNWHYGGITTAVSPEVDNTQSRNIGNFFTLRLNKNISYIQGHICTFSRSEAGVPGSLVGGAGRSWKYTRTHTRKGKVEEE